MRPIREIRGLIYPDEYVIRHFIKRGFDRQSGRELELGCGSGNNLSLYHDMGWSCTGVNVDRQAVSDARHNPGVGSHILRADFCGGILQFDEPFDVLILCGILCYLTGEQGRNALRQATQMLRPGADVFVRTRLLDDV